MGHSSLEDEVVDVTVDDVDEVVADVDVIVDDVDEKTVYSLIVDVVEGLFSIKYAIIIVAIIIARRRAPSAKKIAHKGVQKRQQAPKFLQKNFVLSEE